MKKLKKILWICGRLPSPLFSGDALYSAGVLRALAETNEAAITLVGTRRSDQSVGEHILNLPNLICLDAAPARPTGLRSLLSPLPRDAFNLGTPELQQSLQTLLQQHWDSLVIDHAYSSGPLPEILRQRGPSSICYVAHNAEGAIRPQIASSFGNPMRRILMRLDAEKYRKQENRVLQAADVVTCISEEDGSYFRGFSNNVHIVPPIYFGDASPPRQISSASPRTLLLVGSFEWVAKQRNLELIVQGLLPGLQRNGIRLDVVGTVPQHFRDRFDHFRPHLSFHGRVDDISPYVAAARGGLVPDLLGGGFKLKVLDYAFQRLPIFGLRNALAGTTSEEQSAMFLAENLNHLADVIARNIDEISALNQNQTALFELFSARFGVEAGTRRLRRVFL
ncbi:glycosyltransferase [Bradyrhizobium jicamae]|uniref:Glycosyltransferase n=1 Tax=Bradyrhizobium jicamae TaxID=280332 RepID=A0ABS5FK75_9BRAD|nr:glycosyltransferase [Bradyrhizobium jicamae]MBR0797156.1 glycosyltransferase [Bradyrhizobium jicamae]MBR0934931.1 glycosyltransferase [Bradyrhizobium jicamae]